MVAKGYGKPELYHLKLSVGNSDHREITFGIREVTYDLSLFDSAGHLRRVEVSPTEAKLRNEQVIDVRHAVIKRTAEFYAASLTAYGEHSPAVQPLTDEPGLTDLVIRVNGVKIAVRSGNWGMDDSQKRVSREHLEPFFRLNREANVNIIRNWVGQDTEETFYQLADEYGMMVWNDFWASTQDYNVEPQDVPLFLRNARYVVARFRNHPSIVIWCGRNEGVPQPVLNEGLIQIFREEDGTRYYTPGSNRIDLRNSGPYKYQDPKLFYTTLDRGFSVELGISSLSTMKSPKSSIAEQDLWPISDAWAYHDWHQSGNGDVAPLMQHIEEKFGAAKSLEDFERKTQMFNYVDYRAIFEGFNQHLWNPNGRMLWMTQPAWPSNMWQIYSSDYDTQASFYGVKLACEPVHIQMDLSDFTVAAINTTNSIVGKVTLSARVYSLSNKLLSTKEASVDLRVNEAHNAFQLSLAPLFDANGVVLVRLEMKDNTGRLLSRNLYWLAGQEKDYRAMNNMAPAEILMSSRMRHEGAESVIDLTLRNTGGVAALAIKATLFDAKTNERVLPAYYSDNYVSLLPGESKAMTIRVPDGKKPAGGLVLGLRGWNVPEKKVHLPLS